MRYLTITYLIPVGGADEENMSMCLREDFFITKLIYLCVKLENVEMQKRSLWYYQLEKNILMF